MSIFLITGPPGVGKTTLAQNIAKKRTPTIHIPVDDLREWVISGIAHPIPDWNSETDRQFQIAETAALQLAQTYSDNGFTAVIDHCRDLTTLNKLTANREITKILILLPLDFNLAQNAVRQDKNWDPLTFEPAIKGLHQTFTSEDQTGWIKLTSHNDIENFLISMFDNQLL
ncbi:MAG: AAA family ATPase [Fimbriimonadaceae bacterium]